MAALRLVDKDVIILVGALWTLLTREYSADLHGFGDGQASGAASQFREPPEGRRSDAAEMAVQHGGLTKDVVHGAELTIGAFVENIFVPEYLALKRSPSRAFYRSILKHILRPEEVDRMFSFRRNASPETLKTVPGWPYLSNVRLCDVHADDIQRLTSAAMTRGYSLHTVRHMRDVISAIFTFARMRQCFIGDNPAKLVKTPEVKQKRTFALTVTQAKEALSVMQYPERELTLLSVFTGMSLVEVLGLQWKQVNLSEIEVSIEGRRIGPRAIAVRNQLYRGRLEAVAKSRVRNRSIPSPLFHALLRLRDRPRFTGPNDFVLASQVGTPINQNNILARRLRPIARQLGVPSVSSQTFRRVRDALLTECDKKPQEPVSPEGSSAPIRAGVALKDWRFHGSGECCFAGSEAESAGGSV